MSVGLVTISMWIGMTAVGVVITSWNLRDALTDLGYLTRKQIVDGRALIAKVSIAFEIMLIVVLVLLFIAGVLVAAVQFSPDPPPASLYVRSVILLTIAVLVAHPVLQRWLRRRLTKPTTSQEANP